MSTALRASSADAPAARARWTALRYELPTDDAATRAYLWRQMRARHGINVQRGLWAVPHGRDDCADLDGVVRRLGAAGAEVDVHVVGRDRPDDAELHDRLSVACERLWSGFFRAADGLADRLVGQSDDPGTAGAPEQGLAELHELFARTLADDLVQSTAIDRAVRRLDDLEWIEANVRRRVARPPVHSGRPSIEVRTTLALDDGTLRTVARLTPAPPPSWERELVAFESAVYRDSAARAAVCHGTVVATGTADEIIDTLTRTNERIGRFNVTFS